MASFCSQHVPELQSLAYSNVMCVLLQLYEPFFADFGPLNLGRTARFCRQIHDFLQVCSRAGLSQHQKAHTRPHW